MDTPRRRRDDRLLAVDSAITMGEPRREPQPGTSTFSTRRAGLKSATIGPTDFERHATREERAPEPRTSQLDRSLARIRGEFREMPGLRLTFAQACRLWQLDVDTCEVIIETLLAEGFLARTANGMFVAHQAPRAASALPLKVSEPSTAIRRPRRSA